MVFPGVLRAQRHLHGFHSVGDTRPRIGGCPDQREVGADFRTTENTEKRTSSVS